MKVNERTVVGGVDWPLCPPPQPWREIDAHATICQMSVVGYYDANGFHDELDCVTVSQFNTVQ